MSRGVLVQFSPPKMGDKTFYELNIASAPQETLSSKGDESVASDAPLVNYYPKRGGKFFGLWTLVATLTASLIFSYVIWQTGLFTRLVAQHLVLKKDTQLFEAWHHEPVTTTFSMYLFNYTNLEEFENGTAAKLKLQQIGPFSYTVTTSKENVFFNENGTVSYQERKIYKFSPELTKGSLDDTVTVPSIPFLSAINQITNSYGITRWAMMKIVSGMSPFVKVKISELIWGYDDTIFRLAAAALKYQNQKVPFAKFGLWAGKNGTLPDIITIYTGENDITKKGFISKFNGEKKLHHWGSDECNQLSAYAGSAIAPFLDTKPIYLYTKDACRRVPLEYKRKIMNRGVITNHYEIPSETLSNQGDNECFCSEYCLPRGALNVSACAFGAPIIASNPHFLYGDPSLYSMLDGIAPDDDLHKSYLDIEPNLGMIVDGVTAAQMNIMVRNDREYLPLNQYYPDMLILPVAWIKTSLDDFPTNLHAQLLSIVTFFSLVQIIVYYVPILIMAICILILIYRQFQRDRFDKSIENSIIIESKA